MPLDTKYTAEQLAWLIRRHGIEMTHLSGGSHIGAIMSVADIVAVLYAEILDYDPDQPEWDGRDRFILSKGHAGASIYAALAEEGFFPVEELRTHYANGSRLSGHVSHYLPGVDFSTGSLGHGLGAGAGMAMAAKMDGKQHRVFVVQGDGECNEGSVWEAAQFAAHFQLGHLVTIVDHNHMQSLDWCTNTLDSGGMAGKWQAFGWETVEVDGNDCAALSKVLNEALLDRPADGRPLAIIAHTTKGNGVSFMEKDILWHYRFPHEGWEYDGAVNQLHAVRPEGVEDPYTPDGIKEPAQPGDADRFDIESAHLMADTYAPSFVGLKTGAAAERANAYHEEDGR